MEEINQKSKLYPSEETRDVSSLYAWVFKMF